MLFLVLLLAVDRPERANEGQWNLYQLDCKVRADRGLEPRELSEELCEVAQRRAVEIRSSFGHRNYSAYAKQIGYEGRVGENIAKNGSDVTTLMNQWIRSPGHYRQIVGSANEVGYGVHVSGRNTYGVGVYGRSGIQPRPAVAIANRTNLRGNPWSRKVRRRVHLRR